MNQPSSIQADPGDFDPRRRFVRVTGVSSRGFVEFEFSIGSPELCVELVLPPAAFEEFCAAQAAQRLDADDAGTAHTPAATPIDDNQIRSKR